MRFKLVSVALLAYLVGFASAVLLIAMPATGRPVSSSPSGSTTVFAGHKDKQARRVPPSLKQGFVSVALNSRTYEELELVPPNTLVDVLCIERSGDGSWTYTVIAEKAVVLAVCCTGEGYGEGRSNPAVDPALVHVALSPEELEHLQEAIDRGCALQIIARKQTGQ